MTTQLSRLTKRPAHDKTNPHSHTPFNKLNRDNLISKLHQLSTLHENTQRKMKHLTDKLQSEVERAAQVVDSDTHSDILDILQNHVSNSYPKDSFPYLFWEQQVKASSTHPKGMRWHPMIIKWALYLHSRSSGAYEMLTIMDEMYIRQYLVYDKQTGALIGFANLGNINEQFSEFEYSLQVEDTSSNQLSLAKTMLVIMVEGLFTQLEYPYAQFPCQSLKGDQMYEVFWESVFRIERCGLKLIATTFDGVSQNSHFLRIHQGCTPATTTSSQHSLPYKINNPYADDGREIFFFFDPSHLIKTTRESKARSLVQL